MIGDGADDALLCGVELGVHRRGCGAVTGTTARSPGRGLAVPERGGGRRIRGVEASDRVLLIDLENAVGTIHVRSRILRAKVHALLQAVGPVHHALASYAQADPVGDTVVSVLAELGVAAWRVEQHDNAAEFALISHARYAYQQGCRTFAVASADRAFTALADLGAFDVLAWEGQQVSAKLEDRAQSVIRVARPTPIDPVPAQ